MNTLNKIADAILASREFCGNEREAALDAAHESGIKLTRDIYSKALSIANGTWHQYQVQAGVQCPIDSYERAAIEKVMNNAE